MVKFFTRVEPFHFNMNLFRPLEIKYDLFVILYQMIKYYRNNLKKKLININNR